MNKLKIIFQHDHPLPVLKYGGIERMIFWHMKELVRQGHEVILIGHPDSQVEKYGIRLIKKSRSDWHYLIPSGSDVVNLFYNYAPPVDIPTVNSIGGNGKPGEKFHRNTVFVSQKHAKNHGAQAYIYNALDLSEYPMSKRSSQSWDHFLFLAKASWKVKNLKSCVKACRSQKKNLHIAGGRHWWPSSFIHNYGIVNNEKKIELMKCSDALLFPVLWEEPFGLAMIEAMSQGIPVIGSPYGSLPEIIIPSCGAIVKNYEELIETILDPKKYDSEQIRNHIIQNFSIEKFSFSFVQAFRDVISGGFLNSHEPEWALKKPADELLPF